MDKIKENKDEIGYDKFQVFNGLSFILDTLDKMDRVSELKIPRKTSKSKKVSKPSKMSKTDIKTFFHEWKQHETIKCLQDFLDVGFTEKQVKQWKEEGTIFKPKADGYMVL